METLMSYDWPGNVRELQNCIERMVAMNSGPLLQTADLPSALQTHLEARRPLPASAVAAGAGISVARPQTAPQSGIIPLTEVEKHAIQHALQYTKGDRVMAAYLLGIGLTTLYRKLKEYRPDS
jgi:two-component system response regulator HydG